MVANFARHVLLCQIEQPALDAFHKIFHAKHPVAFEQGIPSCRQSQWVGRRVEQCVYQRVDRRQLPFILPFCHAHWSAACQVKITGSVLFKPGPCQPVNCCGTIRWAEGNNPAATANGRQKRF